MKLLVVTNLYPPQELGGYGRSIADFVWGLRERGHSIQVLSSDAPHLGASSSRGPSGEAVDRGLQLKGSYEGTIELCSQPPADPSDPYQCEGSTPCSNFYRCLPPLNTYICAVRRTGPRADRISSSAPYPVGTSDQP